MSPEHQYVRNATRGLKGQARKDTQAELLDHLTERTRQLTLTGLSPEQARAQAMQELGPTPTVARSLRANQHVHPALSATALLALATTLLWPVPELLSEPWRLSLETTASSVSALRHEGYVTTTELARTLNSYGIQLRRNGRTWVLSHPGWLDAPLGGPDGELGCESPQMSSAADQSRQWLTKLPSAAYVHPSAVLTCMSSAAWPINITQGGMKLNGIPVPTSWYATRTANLHAHQFAQAIQALPSDNWKTSYTTGGGPLIWNWTVRGDQPIRKIKVSTSARRVALLIRGSTKVHFWPPQDPTSNPVFTYSPLTVQNDHTVELPTRISPPGQSPGPLNLLSDVPSWLKASTSSRPAILVALPDRTDAPIDLTPLPFTP